MISGITALLVIGFALARLMSETETGWSEEE